MLFFHRLQGPINSLSKRQVKISGEGRRYRQYLSIRVRTRTVPFAQPKGAALDLVGHGSRGETPAKGMQMVHLDKIDIICKVCKQDPLD